MKVSCVEQCLAHSKYYISAYYYDYSVKVEPRTGIPVFWLGLWCGFHHILLFHNLQKNSREGEGKDKQKSCPHMPCASGSKKPNTGRMTIPEDKFLSTCKNRVTLANDFSLGRRAGTYCYGFPPSAEHPSYHFPSFFSQGPEWNCALRENFREGLVGWDILSRRDSSRFEKGIRASVLWANWVW